MTQDKDRVYPRLLQIEQPGSFGESSLEAGWRKLLRAKLNYEGLFVEYAMMDGSMAIGALIDGFQRRTFFVGMDRLIPAFQAIVGFRSDQSIHPDRHEFIMNEIRGSGLIAKSERFTLALGEFRELASEDEECICLFAAGDTIAIYEDKREATDHIESLPENAPCFREQGRKAVLQEIEESKLPPLLAREVKTEDLGNGIKAKLVCRGSYVEHFEFTTSHVEATATRGKGGKHAAPMPRGLGGSSPFQREHGGDH